jgi:hypothetical protein
MKTALMKTLSVLTMIVVMPFVGGNYSANAASSNTPPAGSVQMTGSEIESAQIGKSWVYKNNDGGVYFDPDGTAKTEWKQKKNRGEWYIENNEICVDVKDWGGEWCYEYHVLDGIIYTWSSTDGDWYEVHIENGNQF